MVELKLDPPSIENFQIGTGPRVLIVAHADRNETIRIISARKTSQGERKQYEEEEN